MSAYFLSEAYQSVYKQRLTEDFNDNLRFVDYMTDEDIESVVESLLWEFQDYGHTMGEAFEFLSEASSPQVITESYELLSEVRNPELRAKARQMKTDARVANRATQLKNTNDTSASVRQNQRASRIKTAISGIKKRLDGPITSVKSAISGAKAGFGMARDGAKNIGAAVNNARKQGQAKLGSLLRTGAQKLGLGRVRDAAKAAHHELSGQGSRERKLKTDLAKNVSNVRKEKRESERKEFGSSVASELRKATSKSSTTPKSSKPVAAKLDLDIRKVSGNDSVRTVQRAPKGFDASKPSSQRRPAYGKKGNQVTGKGVAYSDLSSDKLKVARNMQAVARARKEAGPISARVPRGTTGLRGFRKQRGSKEQVNASYEALLDAILEDLIYEGYANNLDEALYIIENISEEALCEITEEYLAE
jgi:hypothetical protein